MTPSWWQRAKVYLGVLDDELDTSTGPESGTPRHGRDPTFTHEGGVAAPVRPWLGQLSEPPVTSEGDEAAVRRVPATGDQPTPGHEAGAEPAPEPAHPRRIRPSAFQDMIEVGERLKAHEAVIVDVRGLPSDVCRRLIDVSAGLVYGVGGSIARVDQRCFLLRP